MHWGWYVLSEACYPVDWEIRKWDFYGPKQRKTTTGQRTQEQVELVPRLVTRPAPEGPPVTEAGTAVAAAAEAPAANEHSHSGEEREQSGW